MFYSDVILAKKGPLSRIWLAAHWDKKISKQQIFQTDISESVLSIKGMTVPLALRLSGHLLLGLVRIYQVCRLDSFSFSIFLIRYNSAKLNICLLTAAKR